MFFLRLRYGLKKGCLEYLEGIRKFRLIEFGVVFQFGFTLWKSLGLCYRDLEGLFLLCIWRGFFFDKKLEFLVLLELESIFGWIFEGFLGSCLWGCKFLYSCIIKLYSENLTVYQQVWFEDFECTLLAFFIRVLLRFELEHRVYFIKLWIKALCNRSCGPHCMEELQIDKVMEVWVFELRSKMIEAK